MKKHNKIILGSFLMLSMLVTATACDNKSQPIEPSTNTSTSSPSSEEVSSNIGSKYPCITVSKALELAKQAGENGTAEEQYVFARVKTLKSPVTGEMIIEDETGEIYVYGILDFSNLEKQPVKGDLVVIKGTLKTFKDEPEFGKSTLVEFEHVEPEFDKTQYEELTIENARNKEPGSLVKITGTVSNFTYSNPKKPTPNGFFLIDDNASILVHDVDAVNQVQKGNKITIYATRDNYISSRETESAAKYGYKGSIQVVDVIIDQNDGLTNEANLSWVKESTLKRIMNAPLEPNITNTVYKVKAFITKNIGKGFTNYYFDDLDRKTGSYAYSTCDGKDYEWLDPFDGKLCDVYIVPTNCKAEAGGTFYRFIPIDVKETNVALEEKDVAQYVIDYHLVDQFVPEYNANPNLDLITSVSDEVLKFQDAQVTYESSNKDVFDIVKDDKGTRLVAKGDGTSEITIKVNYKTFTAEHKITLTYKYIDISNAVSVKKAIDAEDGTKVMVRGVVMASAVNRDAFYIADETGVMSILTDSKELTKIKQGQMVTFEGTKEHFKKADTEHAIGQETLVNSKLIVNEFGHHDYSTASFDSTQTIDTLNDFNVLEDHSAMVYVVKAKVEFFETQFYSSLKIKSTTSEETLPVYCSNANQYKWLKQFVDQDEVTLELALCNWNDKSHYASCILSAQAGETKVINTLNFNR